MNPCRKIYAKPYSDGKEGFDPRVQEWISSKEELITPAPYVNPTLKHEFPNIRRYKTGKLRILYALSSERPDLWESPPEDLEIIFLYVDLRSDETYREALKYLKKHGYD